MTRDNTIPYTEEEIEQFRASFKTLPTYAKDDRGEYILNSDFSSLGKAMVYEKTPEQFAMFEEFIGKAYAGKLYLEFYIECCRIAHDTGKLAVIQAREADTNGDGYISQDEFKSLIGVLCEHDPNLQKTTFEDFVAQADENKDGKVSIEECGIWIANHVARPKTDP